jgi:hypothetical protein
LVGLDNAPARDFLLRPVGDLLALEYDPAAIGHKNPGQQVEKGGLARAIGSDDGFELALLKAEVHPTDRLQTVETLAQLFSLQNHGPPSRPGPGPSA